jgi:hypothetical protein
MAGAWHDVGRDEVVALAHAEDRRLPGGRRQLLHDRPRDVQQFGFDACRELPQNHPQLVSVGQPSFEASLLQRRQEPVGDGAVHTQSVRECRGGAPPLLADAQQQERLVGGLGNLRHRNPLFAVPRHVVGR